MVAMKGENTDERGVSYRRGTNILLVRHVVDTILSFSPLLMRCLS